MIRGGPGEPVDPTTLTPEQHLERAQANLRMALDGMYGTDWHYITALCRTMGVEDPEVFRIHEIFEEAKTKLGELNLS